MYEFPNEILISSPFQGGCDEIVSHYILGDCDGILVK